MALLEDIVTTINEMTDEELFEALRDIRHNRTKETIILTKAREKKDTGAALLNKMTPELAAMLLKQMGVTA
jgi:uncharacterized protein YrzB (UPF0473 family)